MNRFAIALIATTLLAALPTRTVGEQGQISPLAPKQIPTPPAPPMSLTCTAVSGTDGTAVDLHWQASNTASVTYVVSERASTAAPVQYQVSTSLTLRRDVLIANRNYYYTVRAVITTADGVTAESAPSNEVAYAVPYAERFNVRAASINRSKVGWKQFHDTPFPPTYYLYKEVDATFEPNYSVSVMWDESMHGNASFNPQAREFESNETHGYAGFTFVSSDYYQGFSKVNTTARASYSRSDSGFWTDGYSFSSFDFSLSLTNSVIAPLHWYDGWEGGTTSLSGTAINQNHAGSSSAVLLPSGQWSDDDVIGRIWDDNGLPPPYLDVAHYKGLGGLFDYYEINPVGWSKDYVTDTNTVQSWEVPDTDGTGSGTIKLKQPYPTVDFLHDTEADFPEVRPDASGFGIDLATGRYVLSSDEAHVEIGRSKYRLVGTPTSAPISRFWNEVFVATADDPATVIDETKTPRMVAQHGFQGSGTIQSSDFNGGPVNQVGIKSPNGDYKIVVGPQLVPYGPAHPLGFDAQEKAQGVIITKNQAPYTAGFTFSGLGVNGAKHTISWVGDKYDVYKLDTNGGTWAKQTSPIIITEAEENAGYTKFYVTTNLSLTLPGDQFASLLVNLTSTDAYGGSLGEDNLKFCLLPVEIKKVIFVGDKYWPLESDDAATQYIAPQWADANELAGNPGWDAVASDPNEHNYAVAYTRTTLTHPTMPQIGATFQIHGAFTFTNLKLKATGPDGISIPATTGIVDPSNLTVIMPVTQSTSALPETIKYYNKADGTAFVLDWKISLDGGITWTLIDRTKHTMYVTLADPQTHNNQETIFYLGCKNQGIQIDPVAVAKTIFDQFMSLTVCRVGTTTAMTYWGGWAATKAAENADPNCYYTPGLLKMGDGRCGAWSHLLYDVFSAQGLTGIQIQDIEPNSYLGYTGIDIMVKDWDLSNLSVPIDLLGIPGQGNPNPQGIFSSPGSHAMVSFSGTLYDPSYGNKYSLANMEANHQAWEDAALSGILLQDNSDKSKVYIQPHTEGVQQTQMNPVQY